MTKRAVIYGRVSTDDTKKDNRNIDGQLADCLDYCTKKGYQVIAQLKEDDKGASGAETDLPQLNRIRDMAHNGDFDVLIVREIDRLSRSHEKYYILKYQLLKHNVGIEYVLGDYDNSFAGKLLESFTILMAEEEREQIKRRMVRGKRKKVESGSVTLGGIRPFGYQVKRDSNDKRSLVIDETEGQIVKQIFNWYCEGKSMKWIAHKLSEMVVPTVFDTLKSNFRKKRGYGQWNKSTIGYILGYKTYATGQWVFSEDKITVEIPTLISLEQFEQAQKQRKINTRNNPKNRKNNYLMARRVTCAHCNGAMAGTVYTAKRKTIPDKKYFYYFDPASQTGVAVEKCSNHYNYPVKKIDSYVWDYIASLLSDPKMLEEKLLEQLQNEYDKTGPIREQLEIANVLIIDHTKRLNELIESLTLVGNSKRAKEAVASQIEQTETALDKLETEADKLEKQIASQSKLNEQGIKDLVSLSSQLQDEMKHIKDFELKRKIIERLDVRIKLWIDDDKEKWCKISCLVGENVLCITNEQLELFNLNTQHFESIMITHIFNINSIAA